MLAAGLINSSRIQPARYLCALQPLALTFCSIKVSAWKLSASRLVVTVYTYAGAGPPSWQALGFACWHHLDSLRVQQKIEVSR